MPHKRNPIVSERISGLARLLRGYAQTALENQPLWHERDISHSSAERVILPDATIRSEEHTSELQSQSNLVCRLLLEKKKKKKKNDKTEKKTIKKQKNNNIINILFIDYNYQFSVISNIICNIIHYHATYITPITVSTL